MPFFFFSFILQPPLAYNPGFVPERKVYLWCVTGNGVNFNGVTKGK